MKKLWLLLLPLFLLAAGCSAADAPKVADKTYVGGKITGFDAVPQSEVSVTFSGNQISLNAGCNTLFGDVEWEGAQLRVGTLAVTEIGCDKDLHEQDEMLAQLLVASPTFTLSGSTLEIAGVVASEQVEITLEELKDAPLAGTTWELTGIVANMGVSSLPADVTSTFTLDGDRANFEYGCNIGGGVVEIGENTLQFGPLATTMMMCTPEAMEVEEHVLTVLDGEVIYEISGNSLHIENGEIGLRYTAE